MQQPYRSSPPDAGGVPQRPAQVSSQHADAHIPWRSSSASSDSNASIVVQAAAADNTPVAPGCGPEHTFRVPHPVLSVISWVIAAASAVWLVILVVSLTMIVASGLSHDSEFVMLTYGVYMGWGRALIGVIRFVTRITRIKVFISRVVLWRVFSSFI